MDPVLPLVRGVQPVKPGLQVETAVRKFPAAVTAAASRLRGGTTESPASITCSTSSVTQAAAAMAATYIAPYRPLRVWLTRASRHAISAAVATSPGFAQPYRSVRICAPIHSRNGFPRVAVSGGS